MTTIAFNKAGPARSFDEIMLAKRSGSGPRYVTLTKSQLAGMIADALERHGFTNELPTAPAPRIVTPKTASEIDIAIVEYATTKARAGEGIPNAICRLADEGDATMAALYADYRNALATEAGRAVELNPATILDAKAEREAVEQEVNARARELMAHSPGLSIEAATAKVLDAAPTLYSRYLAAKQRQTGR